jgi:hypothetical protein
MDLKKYGGRVPLHDVSNEARVLCVFKSSLALLVVT